MKRQDRLNWQIRFAEDRHDSLAADRVFVDLFGAEAARLLDDTSWRKSWAAQLTDLMLGSDGFLTFRDNLDYAAAGGVTTAVEPGGSIRTTEVHAAAAEHGVWHLSTAQRLFHH